MRCSGLPWVALLVIACGTPEEPSTPTPEPDPLRYRYDLASDRWAPAPTEVDDGLYWHAPPGMFGVGMGSIERVGASCGAGAREPVPPGRAAVCVPVGARAEVRFVSPPPVGSLPICAGERRVGCVGVRGAVRSTVTPPLSSEDLEEIRQAWRAFLLALAAHDWATIDGAAARGCDAPESLRVERERSAASGAPEAEDEVSLLAARLDELGLWLSGSPDRVDGQGDLPDGPIDAAPFVRLHRTEEGAWLICDAGYSG
ncbi:MAG: hypothetical protein H6719_25275 [Sandaracinaceae bacterium]|nr:hypothetical protein [Sandaracinaceae bacterium]